MAEVPRADEPWTFLLLDSCCGLNYVFPSDIHTLAFGDGAFGRRLGIAEALGWSPLDGISALFGRNTGVLASSLSPPAYTVKRPCEDMGRRRLSVT